VREDDPAVRGRLQHVIPRSVEGGEVAFNVHGVVSVGESVPPAGGIRLMHISDAGPQQ
jgi:hypothetical protein